ncbi:MAG: tetratricopeptide repeat protein [Candidatus Sulfotelmatobacter sp.]
MSTDPPGVAVPAKGDSSSSDVPPEAAVIQFPQAPSDPEATLVDAQATQVDTTPPPAAGRRGPVRSQGSVPVLQSGDVLGGRYEILQLLGEGGMGAVYKAMDRELDRPVALKLIRPELAANPAILARFKQELLLAHQVTHRNVIRIYDLGDADGVKFITMEFVDGEDLRGLIREKKKFSPEDAVEIIQQACLALEAAHSVGVIHRDLKPQNIMRDKTGRVLVMDFGLARTLEGDGMTQTGALVGTMEYMSPEQALAKDLDQRSDLFTLGLILYELLTGVTPYKAESAVASLIKRNSERAIPVSDHDGTIPRALSNIVSKCLERDPNLRYQTAAELLRDLEAWQGNRAAATLGFQPAVDPWGRTIHWPLLTGIATVLVLAIAGYLFRGPLFSSPAKKAASGPALSLAILPFRNASGDPSMDWLGPSLADMLSTDVGQSVRLRTVSQDRLHQVLSDLKISSETSLDPQSLKQVAEFSTADAMVWGQYAKFGEQIRIDATLQDLKHDRRISLKGTAASEKDIPAAVDQLAAALRQNLSLSSDVLKELRASSFQPSSKSVSALREYNQGVQLTREGKNSEALKLFQAATAEDPDFALAFSKLGETYSRLGYDNEAEDAARRAVEKSENLPEAEKFLIAANHFRIAKDYPKAIEAYQNLARVSPDNPDIESALGSIYENAGDFAKAREFYGKVLASNPKDIPTLLAMGRVEILSGNPQASIQPLNYAYSLAVAVDNQEQKGTIQHVLGAAYSYLNKPDDALQNYQQALEIRRKLGEKKGIADSLNMIATTYDGLGKSDLALRNYNDALQIYREIGDKQDTGAVLLNLGQFYDDRGKHDDALKLLKESLQIQRDVRNQNGEALCLNNIGNTYLSKSDFDNARIYFEQALQLRQKINIPGDIAATLHNLGEVSTKTGEYDQALAHYMRALQLYRDAGDKRGAAMEGYSVGTIFEYQGRYGSAVTSKKQAVDDFRTVHEQTYWMGEALGGYGSALSEAGHLDEATKTLDEALKSARELKNDDLAAEVLNWQGDNLFYRGDLKSAKGLYEQALRTAAKTADRNLLLLSKLNFSKAEIVGGQPQNALKMLKNVLGETDALGLQLTVECAIYEAEGKVQLKDYSQARQLLDRAILQSEKLGLRPLLLQAHFSLAKMLAAQGITAEATRHYQQARSLLADLSKEPGSDKIMDRADFKAISSDSDRWLREHS